jgi:hypothetical protein
MNALRDMNLSSALADVNDHLWILVEKNNVHCNEIMLRVFKLGNMYFCFEKRAFVYHTVLH